MPSAVHAAGRDEERHADVVELAIGEGGAEMAQAAVAAADEDPQATLRRQRVAGGGGVVKLVAENNLYPPIVVKSGEELSIWGVVTYNLHKLY